MEKEIDKFYEFLGTLPNLDPKIDKIGESFYNLKVNYPPFLGVVIDLTNVNNKPVVIFHEKDANITRYYCLTKVEMGSKDYDKDGKYMRSFKVDNKFWFYEERIQNALIGNGITCSLGFDMSMPFLMQQDWKDITNII
jgi:hypothetical protein